jgi:DNA polymerase III subunit chi
MGEARFYHLQRSTLESALPKLLTKTLERGWRAVVLAGSPERAAALNQHLWTFDPASFLPHGAAEDGFAERQPIWLTCTDENPNGAQVLMLADGMTSDHLASFEVVCDIFDGRDEEATAAARLRWTACKSLNLSRSYWQENERGGWERKA